MLTDYPGTEGRSPRVAVFVDTDVAVRHFLDSDTFSSLREWAEVTLFLPPLGHPRIAGLQDSKRWCLPVQHVNVPDLRVLWWKRLFYLDQMRWRPGRDWETIRRGYADMIGHQAASLFSILSLPILRPFAKPWILRQLGKYPATELDTALDAFAPDIILHPSVFQGVYINDLLRYGKDRRVPVALLMNSWDNPSLKRGAVFQPDAVVVWGEQTAKHAARYMGVDPRRIHTFGAAQFDCFRGPPEQSRDEVAAEHHLSADSRIIFYAGSSKGNDEVAHLQLLDRAIDQGRLAGCKVLYRPHPYLADANQAEALLNTPWRHVALEQTMREFLRRVAAKKTKGFFSTPYSRTHSLLSAVDIVVSPMSTILIEAALHGKQPICVVPLDEDETSGWKNIRMMPCFDDLLHSPAIRVVTELDDLLPALEDSVKSLADPSNAERLRTQIAHFVELTGQPYAQRLNGLVKQFLGQPNAGPSLQNRGRGAFR